MVVPADDQQLLQKLHRAAEEGELSGIKAEPDYRLVFMVFFLPLQV